LLPLCIIVLVKSQLIALRITELFVVCHCLHVQQAPELQNILTTLNTVAAQPALVALPQAKAVITVPASLVPLPLADTEELGVLKQWRTEPLAAERYAVLFAVYYYLQHYSSAEQSAAYKQLLVELAQSVEDCIYRASSALAESRNADSCGVKVQWVAKQFAAKLSTAVAAVPEVAAAAAAAAAAAVAAPVVIAAAAAAAAAVPVVTPAAAAAATAVAGAAASQAVPNEEQRGVKRKSTAAAQGDVVDLSQDDYTETAADAEADESAEESKNGDTNIAAAAALPAAAVAVKPEPMAAQAAAVAPPAAVVLPAAAAAAAAVPAAVAAPAAVTVVAPPAATAPGITVSQAGILISSVAVNPDLNKNQKREYATLVAKLMQ
jgi:hypothetical protein